MKPGLTQRQRLASDLDQGCLSEAKQETSNWMMTDGTKHFLLKKKNMRHRKCVKDGRLNRGRDKREL